MGPLPLLVVAVVVLLFVWEYRRRVRLLQQAKELNLDGPEPNVVFGNLLHFIDIIRNKGYEFTPQIHIDLHKKYGETMALYFGMNNLQINTIDLGIMKEVFIKQFSKFVDREDQHPFFNTYPMGESLLQIGRFGPHKYGWKEVRSVVSPTFTTGKMKQMHYIMSERALSFIRVLREKVQKSPEIDIYDEFQAVTLDVIGRTAFGIQSDSLSDRTEFFYCICRKFFSKLALTEDPLLVVGFLFPSLGPLLRPFSSLYQLQCKIANDLKVVIEERKAHINEFDRVDLIQLLLKEDEERQARENKPPMHIDTIVSNCFAFLLAGYETTSTSLAYTAYLLAQHPEVQEKLHSEILEALGDRDADYDSVMKLPYLDAVFHESLRLKPPVVAFTGRTCIEDALVNGLKVPKGASVVTHVHAVHWNAEFWPEPHKFDPERFTHGKTFDPLTWIPFGIGPRQCAGIRFAELEFKLTMAEVLRKFKLELAPNTPQPLLSKISAILYRPVAGVPLRLVERT